MARDTTGYRARLRSIGLFSACTDAELDTLDALLTEVTVPAGKELVHEAHVARQSGVIVDGEAVVSRGGNDIARLGPGDVFGELSLLDGRPRTATVTAATDMRLFVLDPSQFDRLVSEVPSVGDRIRAAAEEHRE